MRKFARKMRKAVKEVKKMMAMIMLGRLGD